MKRFIDEWWRLCSSSSGRHCFTAVRRPFHRHRELTHPAVAPPALPPVFRVERDGLGGFVAIESISKCSPTALKAAKSSK